MNTQATRHLSSACNHRREALGKVRSVKKNGHIVNTASIAGLLNGPMSSTYHVAKFGVVALSEALFYQVRGTKVGVSVRCPGFVNTGIVKNLESLAETREGLYQPSEEDREAFKPFLENLERQLEKGTSPDTVAQW